MQTPHESSGRGFSLYETKLFTYSSPGKICISSAGSFPGFRKVCRRGAAYFPDYRKTCSEGETNRPEKEKAGDELVLYFPCIRRHCVSHPKFLLKN